MRSICFPPLSLPRLRVKRYYDIDSFVFCRARGDGSILLSRSVLPDSDFDFDRDIFSPKIASSKIDWAIFQRSSTRIQYVD